MNTTSNINLLVISDDIELTLFFVNLIEGKKIQINYSLAHSFNNKEQDTFIACNSKPINLKDESTIQYLICTYNLIISLHCKQIFPANLVKNVRCINLHPGFNPYNRGMFPHVFSIINKKKTGVTIHIMDEAIDHGDIIFQKEVPIFSYDTSFDVYQRIREAEKELLSSNLIDIINGSYSVYAPNEEGNYNSLNDYKKLCNLDLKHYGNLQEHLDLLRALSHDGYWNAYFVEQGKKIFVKISFKVEVYDTIP